GLHPARKPADRRGARATRDAPGSRTRARRQPAGPEAAERPLTAAAQAPQEEGAGGAGAANAERAAAGAASGRPGRRGTLRRRDRAGHRADDRTVTPAFHEGPYGRGPSRWDRLFRRR